MSRLIRASVASQRNSRQAHREGVFMKDWSVYILECSDKTYYIGITNNLEKRLKDHQGGKAARYTARRLPVKLCYSMGGYSQSEARKEEIVLKDWRKEKKKKLINGTISRLKYLSS